MKRLLTGLALGGVLVLTACQAVPTPSPTATTPGTPSPDATATASSTPGATASASASPSASATMLVTLYFGNVVLDPGVSECAQVYAVHREVPASGDVLTVTLKELLAGPTTSETAQGYRSWFSPATAQALVKARVVGNTSYVNLTDVRTVIPNASTSCGSASLLAQLRTTSQQASMAPRVLYAINGQPALFWEWLQMGCDASNDQCDPAPFVG